MLINFTNHPSALWSAEQKAAAQVYGKVIDLAFPAIDPATNEAVLDSLAAVYADHILHLNPDAVLCQGECTFVYRVVQRLEAAGIPTLAACSRRKSQETTYPDGSTEFSSNSNDRICFHLRSLSFTSTICDFA